MLSEVVLVLVIGVVGLAGNYFALNELTTQIGFLDFALNDNARFQLQQRLIEPVVGAVLLWVWFAIGSFAVGWLYSAVGTTYLALKRTAWALFPMLIANVVNTAAVFWTATNLDLAVEDLDVQTSLPGPVAEEIWSQVGSDPVVVGSVAVSIVFVAWTGYITAYAIRDVRDLTTAEAYRVAAVPTVGYALYVAYQVVGAL